MMATSMLPSSAYIRVERNTSLTLSTSWQRIDFKDASALNANTFTTAMNNKKLVEWDTTNKLFTFNTDVDRNFAFDIDYSANISNVITTLLATNVSAIQWRFVIPNGVSPGVPFCFPNPQSTGVNGYGESGPVNLKTPWRDKIPQQIRSSANIRTNGLGFEMRLSIAPVLGTISLDFITAICYGR